MMVEYLGYPAASQAIEAAVRGAVSQNETTQDLGGTLSTKQAGDAILSRLGLGLVEKTKRTIHEVTGKKQ